MGTNGDDPNKGEINAHNIQEGDVLVVGSDGLWDNLHRASIVELVKPFVRGDAVIKDPALVAQMIADEAEKYSYLQHYMSPFAESARAHQYDYIGGKPDDISVIVA